MRDAESLRRHLLGDQPWTVLGQSFGGFCVWTYLSFSAEGLRAAYVTGGVPPVGVHPDDVYRATRRAVDRRTADLDADHPEARAVLADVARHLLDGADERLPTGERLTVGRLQEVGHGLGAAGGPDLVARLAEDAWAVPGRRLSDPFLVGRRRTGLVRDGAAVRRAPRGLLRRAGRRHRLVLRPGARARTAHRANPSRARTAWHGCR